MRRILAVLAVLSMIFIAGNAKAESRQICVYKTKIISNLITYGFVPVFQMASSDNRVIHIYIHPDGRFVAFRIEENGSVCSSFSGRQFSQFKRRSL